jgi:hypothetical protein
MATLFVLRLIHILFGAFWFGAALFLATFMVPTIKALGPAGAPVMQHLTRVKKLSQHLLGVAWLTILSGFGLAMYDAGSLGMAWFRVGPGRAFGAGAVFALAAVSVGMVVSMPTARRIGALGEAIQAGGKPPSPEQQGEMGRLQARQAVAARLIALLLACAVAAMSVARYMQ